MRRANRHSRPPARATFRTRARTAARAGPRPRGGRPGAAAHAAVTSPAGCNGPRGHHRYQVRTVLGGCVQVGVEPRGVDLHRLRGVGGEALRERILERRRAEHAPARHRSPRRARCRRPVCATNTPTSAKRDAGFGNFTYAAFFGTGKRDRGDDLVRGQRRLVHALEEIVGGDLALVGDAPSRPARGPRPASPRPDRCWRASPPIVPMLRTCRSPMPSASAASAGIARFTSVDAATSAWRVIAPITMASPSLRMPVQVGDARQVDERARLREAQLHRGDQALAAGERLAAGLREQRGGVGDGLGCWYSNAYMVGSFACRQAPALPIGSPARRDAAMPACRGA